MRLCADLMEKCKKPYIVGAANASMKSWESTERYIEKHEEKAAGRIGRIETNPSRRPEKRELVTAQCASSAPNPQKKQKKLLEIGDAAALQCACGAR